MVAAMVDGCSVGIRLPVVVVVVVGEGVGVKLLLGRVAVGKALVDRGSERGTLVLVVSDDDDDVVVVALVSTTATAS